jgi:hypothetical protein
VGRDRGGTHAGWVSGCDSRHSHNCVTSGCSIASVRHARFSRSFTAALFVCGGLISALFTCERQRAQRPARTNSVDCPCVRALIDSNPGPLFISAFLSVLCGPARAWSDVEHTRELIYNVTSDWHCCTAMCDALPLPQRQRKQACDALAHVTDLAARSLDCPQMVPLEEPRRGCPVAAHRGALRRQHRR